MQGRKAGRRDIPPLSLSRLHILGRGPHHHHPSEGEAGRPDTHIPLLPHAPRKRRLLPEGIPSTRMKARLRRRPWEPKRAGEGLGLLRRPRRRIPARSPTLWGRQAGPPSSRLPSFLPLSAARAGAPSAQFVTPAASSAPRHNGREGGMERSGGEKRPHVRRLRNCLPPTALPRQRNNLASRAKAFVRRGGGGLWLAGSPAGPAPRGALPVRRIDGRTSRWLPPKLPSEGETASSSTPVQGIRTTAAFIQESLC